MGKKRFSVESPAKSHAKKSSAQKALLLVRPGEFESFAMGAEEL